MIKKCTGLCRKRECRNIDPDLKSILEALQLICELDHLTHVALQRLLCKCHSSQFMATKYNSEILSAVMVWQWQSKVWLYLLTSLLMFSSPMDWHTALYTLVNRVNFSFTFVSTPYIRTTTMSQFFQVIKDICHLGEESLFPPFVLVLLGRFALSKGNHGL